MPDLIGLSFGRYHILEQLGEGGMATVYKAYDTRLERDVAVKVIRRGAFPPDQLTRILKRFEREAKALAQLSHPNIIGVIDYGDHEGSPYLVMPFISGGTLKQRLGNPIPWQEAARILLPTARALKYAHGQGVVHRDVKPSNILITLSGEPMLSDFGIAKLLESEETTALTGTGMGVGTPEYMAPEQWTGKVTPQADIYSLGVVFYEMVTGRKPYLADTPAAILLKQATEPLPRPTQFVPDLPEAVEKVLLKALARKPEDRYADMAAFAAALEALQGIRGTTAHRSRSEDSMATIDQGIGRPADPEATRDQYTGADVPPPLPPSPGPAPASPAWRWLVPVGIAALLLIVCVVVVVTVWLVKGGFSTEPIAIHSPSPVSMTETSGPADTPIPNPPTATTVFLPTATLVPTLTPLPPGPTGKIVFTCQISGLSEQNEICLMNADGSQYRQLTTNGVNNSFPSLSPDGKSVVFTSNISGTEQVYELNLASGATRQLTYPPGDGVAADISPDGKSIVYKHGDQLDAVWVMNRDGSNPHMVYYLGWDPVWSPDGNRILFTSGSLSQPQLHVINSDGSGLYQVTNMSNLRGRSDWSSKGLLSTYSGIKPDRNIYIMNTDGSGLEQITKGGDDLAPSFSPDGNWITFMSYIDHPGDSNGCEIYIMRVDGSDWHRLTNNNYCDWQPRWGP
jgi:Tol biopolymer transport system component/tRNA A-37 threonylcarbamoyl transferase component Bud32